MEEKKLQAFGKNLKQLRKKYGFTQESLAAAAGLDLSHIARMETAKRNPKLTTLMALAHAFGISFSELMDFKVPARTKDRTGGSN